MLDLFDLDEAFSSEMVRLAQLSNKCEFSGILVLFAGQVVALDGCLNDCVLSLGTSDDDLEFYVRKCGEILGVTGKLDKDQRDAKHILEHIFFQVVAFKKLNQVSWSIHTWSNESVRNCAMSRH